MAATISGSQVPCAAEQPTPTPAGYAGASSDPHAEIEPGTSASTSAATSTATPNVVQSRAAVLRVAIVPSHTVIGSILSRTSLDALRKDVSPTACACLTAVRRAPGEAYRTGAP